MGRTALPGVFEMLLVVTPPYSLSVFYLDPELLGLDLVGAPGAARWEVTESAGKTSTIESAPGPLLSAVEESQQVGRGNPHLLVGVKTLTDGMDQGDVFVIFFVTR